MSRQAPRETAPAAGEVHIWRIELPEAEGRPAARRALRAVLAAYLGDSPDAIALATAGNGKPELAEAPERLPFNLSRSRGLALVAVGPAGVAVGVDVELIRPRRDLERLAARWLASDDALAIAAASDPAEREALFYAAWTRHEARAKCSGAGLAGPPPGPEVVAWQLDSDADHAAAVALDTVAAGAALPQVTVRLWNG
jgi:4'-phosphopantetheinyl transferase